MAMRTRTGGGTSPALGSGFLPTAWSAREAGKGWKTASSTSAEAGRKSTPLPLNRRLLCAFWYEGKEYDFNFSKLHEQVKTDFSFDEYGPQGPADDDLVHWHVRQESMRAVMETDVYCRKSEMLFVNYEAPDGSKKHQRLWNGGTGFGFVRLYEKEGSLLTLVDEIEASHVGCEYGEYGERED